MLFYILSFLASIAFWLWIIMKYDRFEREPLKNIIFVMIVGGLISIIPARIFNVLFSNLIGFRFEEGFSGGGGIDKTALLFGFVGLNEEIWKAFATVAIIILNSLQVDLRV